MKAEHLKGWLGEIQHKEKVARENPGKEGADLGLSCKWRIFVELIQIICERGEILEQMSWMVVVLLPKGGGDFWGIGLLDPCWKVVDKIMVCTWLPSSFTHASTENSQSKGRGWQQLRLSWHSNWPGFC
jgi:hypothetical protein